MGRSVPSRLITWRPLLTILELLAILLASLALYLASSRYDWLEQLVSFAQRHEDWEVDEFFTVAILLMMGFGCFAGLRWREALLAQRRLKEKARELEQAISEIHQLRGIIPICAACKRVRDDQGYWHQVEHYIRERTEAEFSHSLCLECAARLYPELSLGSRDGDPSGN